MDSTQEHRTAISIVVTRADGTVEDLGVVSYHDPDEATEARVRAQIARGERVDETDVIKGAIRISGSAVKGV